MRIARIASNVRLWPRSRRSFAWEAKHSKASVAYTPLPDHQEDLPVGAIIRYPHRSRAHMLNPGELDPDRGMAVAVIGASGNTGRQIALALAAKKAHFAGLGPMTLQFVGRREGDSLGTLVGLCTELRDAFEVCPHLEVVPDLEAVRADIIIMAAGATMSDKYKTHADLARVNATLFEDHARALLKHNSKALVLVVSSPVDFGVDAFVDAGFDPRFVLGTGAFLDTQRFRREIASELKVPRQIVKGFVLGMHGLAMVPCWSTVHLAAIANPAAHEKLAQMKDEGLARMPKDVDQWKNMAYKVRELASHGNALQAAALVNQQPPDMRAALRRYISFFSGPLYPRVGIGEAVAKLIVDMLDGHEIVTAAQVRVGGDLGDFLGIKNTAIGAPIIMSGHGATLAPIQLESVEEEAVRMAADGAKALKDGVKAINMLRQGLKRTSKRDSADDPHSTQ